MNTQLSSKYDTFYSAVQDAEAALTQEAVYLK